MPGENRLHLRVVGGNAALARAPRLSREVRWPPLRVVGESEADALKIAVLPQPMRATQNPRAAKRAAWSQALLAGLVVVMLSSVGQAIAANW
jgi:hypothetical protein